MLLAKPSSLVMRAAGRASSAEAAQDVAARLVQKRLEALRDPARALVLR